MQTFALCKCEKSKRYKSSVFLVVKLSLTKKKNNQQIEHITQEERFIYLFFNVPLATD